MVVDISKKVIKPHRCVMGLGIPISREAFFADLRLPTAAFAKRYYGGWGQYEDEVASVVDEVGNDIDRLGGTVVRGLTLKGFGELFRRDTYDVIVVFCHREGDAIEFRDGLAAYESIVSLVPPDFTSILDLTVCNSCALAKQIRSERDFGLVTSFSGPATPAIWLYFYRILFQQLSDNDTSYLKAWNTVVKAIFRK